MRYGVCKGGVKEHGGVRGTLEAIGGAWTRSTPRNYSKFRRAAAMSLYYEAAAILANAENIGGSLKSRLFTKKDLKSSPGQIFALIAEASKWSVVLKDVIEKTGLLAEEKKVHIGPPISHLRRMETSSVLQLL